MANYFIKVEKLKKSLKSRSKKFVLDDISFELYQSEITALLGLNGAGKTTLIKLMLSLLEADSGSITLSDNIIGNKGIKRIGYLPESFAGTSYELTVNSFLRFICNLNGVPSKKIEDEIDKVLEAVELTDHKKQLVAKLSKGMRTRLGLAQSLIGDPLLLILDEPTDGLDPQGRKDIIRLLNNLKKSGKTILISSHVLGEIENLADSILILDQGKLLLSDKIADIIQSFNAGIDSSDNLKEDENNIPSKIKSVEELFFYTIKGK